MPLKPDKYRHHFDQFDLSEAQKTAMCEAICTIAEAFADLAFDIARSPQLDPANDNDSPSESNVIEFPRQPATHRNMESKASLLIQVSGELARKRP